MEHLLTNTYTEKIAVLYCSKLFSIKLVGSGTVKKSSYTYLTFFKNIISKKIIKFIDF